jgi:hypothetical protein
MKLDPSKHPSLPVPANDSTDDNNSAADLIRHKLDTIYNQ